jgi:hypothetical protein
MGGIPWERSSRRGKWLGLARRPDHRQERKLERDEERERMREEEKRPLRPSRYKG